MSILDLCQCGDWRHFHRCGRCACGCTNFRLATTEAEYAAREPKHYELMLKLKPAWEKDAKQDIRASRRSLS